VIDFVHDGIIAVDGQGTVILFNAIAHNLLLAKASLMREESRGTYYRADFPEQKADYSFSIKFSKDKAP
jgi:aspartate oxidase